MFSIFGRDDSQAVYAAQDEAQAIVRFSVSGQVKDANANFLALMGYQRHELLGQHHSIFCEPSYAGSESYRQFWLGLASGKAQVSEFKRLRRDGLAVWVQAIYAPVRDRKGQVTEVVKIASDITALKTDTLEHTGRSTAIDRVQAIIEFAPDGKILAANENFLRSFGYRLEEIVGQHHRMLCEDSYIKDPAYRTFWDALANGDYQAGEFKRLGRSGKVVYIQASYNPIFDDNGRVTKVVKFATDITPVVERRLRNERLSQAIFADLQAVVGEIGAVQAFMTNTSGATEETNATVSAVAAAAEELAQSVNEISFNMSSAQSHVESASNQANAAIVASDRMSSTAASLTDVISLIQNIASQINLLALNATIESARAGEAGKGFAVVATEVKMLANQASAASKTISNEIAQIQAISSEVGGALVDMRETFNHVLQSVTNIAGAMSQQTSATGEISSNMQAASSAVGEIQSNIYQVNASMGEVSSSAEKVRRDVEAIAG